MAGFPGDDVSARILLCEGASRKTGLPGDALLEKEIFLVTMTVAKQVFLKRSTKQVVLVTTFLGRKARFSW